MKLFGLACIGWLAATASLSQAGPIGRSPVLFTSAFLISFGLVVVLVRTCPREWSFGKVVGTAVLLGLLGRALLFWSFPVGNDVYRYIWEGYIQNHGFNPYRRAPDDPLLAHLISGDMAAIWPFINHKDLSAAYPPLVMLLFRGLAAVSPTPMMFKTAMVGFDLLTLAVLAAIVRLRKVPHSLLFWYALNPFVLVYVAGEAHLDIVQAAFLLCGLLAVLSRRPLPGFLSLGAAAASKYFAAAALPFVMKRSNLYAWPAAAAAGLLFIPYAGDPQALFRSLVVFGSRMHYNDGVADILRLFLGTAALPVLALFLLGVLAIIDLLEHDPLRSVYLAMGAVLVCLPTLHPWYLLLMAPLMVVYPSRAWLYLMAAATLVTLPVRVHEIESGLFREIRWLKVIEYIPFYVLLILDTLRGGPILPAEAYPVPRTVSVVVPVLNEADRIPSAVRSAQAAPEVVQIIVTDGGSHDATIAAASRTGALVVSGPRGRGCQVKTGTARATGDVILILHADSDLKPGAVERMLRELAAAPSIPGGAFEMAFQGDDRKLRWVARLNNWRARWLGIAFGDQGQFVRRQALASIGGFPDQRLMEDVELSMRLKRFGRPLFVKDGVCVSPRRWAGADFTGNFWKVITLFLRYLVERRFNGPAKIRTDYYGRYYGRQ